MPRNTIKYFRNMRTRRMKNARNYEGRQRSWCVSEARAFNHKLVAKLKEQRTITDEDPTKNNTIFVPWLESWMQEILR